jgi:serine/threonine-protein kinase
MMLTQRPPFFGGDLVGLSMRILGEPHVPVRERRDDVPEALAAVIDRCLAKTPEDRFASVRALRSALEPFAGEVPSVHLDDDTILAMQEGRLAGTKLAAVEAHVSACEACMALVAIAGPSQARSHAPPLLGMHDATVTGHRLATTVNDDLAPTIATPRGASARAMATLISGENSTVSGEIAASSTHSVGGVAAAIPRGSTLASGPMAVPVAPPPKPPALVALAGMLVIALVGVGGVVILKRPSPPVAVAAPPPTTAEPVPTATETPVEAAPPLPLPTPSIAPSTTTAAKKPPAPRPKHAAPTPKVGEIPNER